MTNTLLEIARGYLRSAAGGLSLLFARPRELPVNLFLVMRYLWDIRIKGKELLVLVREGGIGDFLCVLACVPGLRQRHPVSWLVLIAPRGCRQLALSSGLADAVAEANGFFHRLVERSCPPSNYYQPYLPDEHIPAQPQTLHLADEFAQALGVSADPHCVHFQAPDQVRRRLKQRLRHINPEGRPAIVLHPGPTWPVREWPLQRWCELTELIRDRTSAIMIKIGTDRDSMRRVRPVGPISNAIDWTNQLTVPETVALLEQVSAFIGIDSGPLHLAGFLGVPSVGLFGPISGDRRIHPRAATVTVTGHVDCLGCHHSQTGPVHWRTGCPNDIACMRYITAEEVFEALTNCLSEPLAGGYGHESPARLVEI